MVSGRIASQAPLISLERWKVGSVTRGNIPPGSFVRSVGGQEEDKGLLRKKVVMTEMSQGPQHRPPPAGLCTPFPLLHLLLCLTERNT